MSSPLVISSWRILAIRRFSGGVRVKRVKGQAYPEFVEINGQRFPTQQVDALSVGGKKISGIYPKPIAEMIEVLRSMKVNEPQPFRARQIAHYITGIRLAIPAEAIVHGINVLGGLSATADLGTSIQAAALARVGGPGRFVAAILENITPFNEGYARMEQILAKNGGFRTRGFGGQEGLLPKWFEKALGLEQLRDGVFGLRGLESNSRVLLGQSIERMRPGISGAELAFEVNEALGTYVRGLEPGVVRSIKQWGIDPFATAGLSLHKTGLRLMAGLSPGARIGVEGFNGILASQVWLGSLGFWALWNMVQDHKHRWPWNAGIDPTKILLYDDGMGNRAALDIRLWNPILGRALSLTGGKSLLRGLMARPGDSVEQYVADAIRDSANAAVFNRPGPAVRTGSIALFGVAPHLGSDLKPFQVARKPSTTESKFLLQIEAAIAGLNPSLELMSGEVQGRDKSKGLLENLLGTVTGIQKTNIPSELWLAANPERQREKRVREFVTDLYSRVSRDNTFTIREQFEMMRDDIMRREGDIRSRAEAFQMAASITQGALVGLFRRAGYQATQEAHAAEVVKEAVQQNTARNQKASEIRRQQATGQSAGPQAQPFPQAPLPSLQSAPPPNPNSGVQGSLDSLLNPTMRRKLEDIKPQ